MPAPARHALQINVMPKADSAAEQVLLCTRLQAGWAMNAERCCCAHTLLSQCQSALPCQQPPRHSVDLPMYFRAMNTAAWCHGQCKTSNVQPPSPPPPTPPRMRRRSGAERTRSLTILPPFVGFATHITHHACTVHLCRQALPHHRRSSRHRVLPLRREALQRGAHVSLVDVAGGDAAAARLRAAHAGARVALFQG